MGLAARHCLRCARRCLLLLAALVAVVLAGRRGLFCDDWLCSTDSGHTCVVADRGGSDNTAAAAAGAAAGVTAVAEDGLATAAKFPVAAWAIREYSKQLAAAPVLTKAVTSAVVGWAGDVLAQWFEMRNAWSTKAASFVSACVADERKT